jgi:predicted RNA-binding Zn-ribbon protein involved in translation (DUF1610 family)
MPEIKLPVVPKPDLSTRTVLEPAKDFAGPFIKGTGDVDYLCGSCGAVLVERVTTGQIKNTVFRCPNCGQYNELV